MDTSGMSEAARRSDRPVWVHYPDREALAAGVADTLASAIDGALAQRGQVTLALAGGSTPVPAYRRLADSCPQLVHACVTPTDERWVTQDDPLSNARMLHEALGPVRSIVQLAACDRASDPDTPGALDPARTALAELSLPFDGVVLGMGTDGHFASLFPDDPGIDAALASRAWVVAAHPAGQPTPRVSLTPYRLLQTRELLLVIAGADKRDVLQRAMRDGPVEELPIRAALRCGQTLRIHYSP